MDGKTLGGAWEGGERPIVDQGKDYLVKLKILAPTASGPRTALLRPRSAGTAGGMGVGGTGELCRLPPEQRFVSKGFRPALGRLAALVALAVALASLGGQSHGVQAETPLTGAAEYGGTTWTAGARLAGATEPSAPSADVEEEDNQLGEAYRLEAPKSSGIRWLSATKVNVGFYGHPSTVAVGDLACSVEGSDGTSAKTPDNPRTGFGVSIRDLTPNTTYQFCTTS